MGVVGSWVPSAALSTLLKSLLQAFSLLPTQPHLPHFLPDLTSYFPLQEPGVAVTLTAGAASPGETSSDCQGVMELSWGWGWELEFG